MNGRVDARDKVTGSVHYGDDRVLPGLLHAGFAVATVGRGRITSLDTEAAEAVPGVRLVLSHLDDLPVKSAGFLMTGMGFAFQSWQPLTSDHVAYRGQAIALVVAETPHAAVTAASLIHASYSTEPFSVELDAEGVEVVPQSFIPDSVVGDADAVLENCAITVDGIYDCPPQHQMAMELMSTVVEWQGETLVVHESSQNSGAIQNGLAAQLGIPARQVQVISPYAGGGFGQRNSLQNHTVLAAVAARQLERPVKLVMSRPQIFHNTSFRPTSRHHVRLGIDPAGKLQAAVHEIDQQTSRHDLFPAMYTDVTARLYGIPNFRGRHQLVRTDVQTPGYMRAPFEHPGVFAFETAVDEIACSAGIDPLEFRLANDTQADSLTGRPFSSRFMAECLRMGAARFGWSARNPLPGSMVAPDGSSIGWGVAIGVYGALITPAVARVSADAQGGIRVEVTGHEMGQGIRTAIVSTAVGNLGIAASDVTVVVGDTRAVPQHLTAGSWGTASALPAVHLALQELRSTLGLPLTGAVDVASAVVASGEASVRATASHQGAGQPEAAFERLRNGLPAMTGPEYPEFVSFSHVAHFVEVRVERSIRRVRIPRVVSVADCGRVVSPVTAASQLRGGVIWGIGGTLREASEVDPRYGGFLNADFAEYAIPVNADIGSIDVSFVDQRDPQLNVLGVKGLGEVAMVGVAPAIGNAIFHATGRRLRRLPIRIEDLL
jgi:xanthine dehydrogenase YagR molybdenum-binding subunit